MKGINGIAFIILAFALLSFLVSSGLASAYVSLSITSATIPSTLDPGTKGSLLLTITNAGTDFASQVQLLIHSSSNVVPDISNFNLGTINSGGSIQVTVPITVSPSSPEGSISLPFTISYQVGNAVGATTTDNSATITVTKRTLIEITNVSYDTDQIQRGNTVTMTVTLQNVGTGQIKDMTVSMRNFTSLPVAPAGSDTQKFLGDIMPGQSSTFSFVFVVSNDAGTVTYSLPIYLNYFDDQGIPQADVKFAGLKVVGIPDFVIALDSNTGYLTGTSNQMSVTVSNVGTGSAQFVTMFVDGGQAVSPQTTYIGTLNPDDSSSNTLDVNLAGKPAGQQTLNVTLTYKDSYNQQFVESRLITFFASNPPLVLPTNYFILLIVVILVLAYWKRHFLKSLLRRKR